MSRVPVRFVGMATTLRGKPSKPAIDDGPWESSVYFVCGETRSEQSPAPFRDRHVYARTSEKTNRERRPALRYPKNIARMAIAPKVCRALWRGNQSSDVPGRRHI